MRIKLLGSYPNHGLTKDKVYKVIKESDWEELTIINDFGQELKMYNPDIYLMMPRVIKRLVRR